MVLPLVTLRVATQQRRRTEAVADEAASVLRRALEAQRLLRHEVRRTVSGISLLLARLLGNLVQVR